VRAISVLPEAVALDLPGAHRPAVEFEVVRHAVDHQFRVRQHPAVEDVRAAPDVAGVQFEAEFSQFYLVQ
jgi:hypothetical protein